jgi:hypothetical protein
VFPAADFHGPLPGGAGVAGLVVDRLVARVGDQ